MTVFRIIAAVIVLLGAVISMQLAWTPPISSRL